MTAVDVSVLDNPVCSSLGGRGLAVRFPADVAPFAGVVDPGSARAWAELGALVSPGEVVVLVGVSAVPASWEVVVDVPGVQMDGSAVLGAVDAEAVVLGAADVPEMMDLVRRTEPGPFLPRTTSLGRYVGIRRGGALVAMAGERMRPPGWTEISAVCTDPAYRGQGLARRLVDDVAAGIRARGEVPFLHTAAANVNAIRLYEAMGFVLRRTVTFKVSRLR